MHINPSLASFPSATFVEAAHRVVAGVTEPLLGTCRAEVLQLVPQAYGILDEAVCDELQSLYPGKELRLHANVRLGERRVMADLSGLHKHAQYFARLAELNRHIRGTVYTAHAGRRSEATIQQMLDHCRRLEDRMGCIVAVEGHYPTAGDVFLVSSWSEYRSVFKSGVRYVVDLSHINIVAEQSGERDDVLVQEMLACERCIEVHISDNNGAADSHQQLSSPPWWWDMMKHIHPRATVFSEGKAR